MFDSVDTEGVWLAAAVCTLPFLGYALMEFLARRRRRREDSIARRRKGPPD